MAGAAGGEAVGVAPAETVPMRGVSFGVVAPGSDAGDEHSGGQIFRSDGGQDHPAKAVMSGEDRGGDGMTLMARGGSMTKFSDGAAD